MFLKINFDKILMKLFRIFRMENDGTPLLFSRKGKFKDRLGGL